VLFEDSAEIVPHRRIIVYHKNSNQAERSSIQAVSGDGYAIFPFWWIGRNRTMVASQAIKPRPFLAGSALRSGVVVEHPFSASLSTSLSIAQFSSSCLFSIANKLGVPAIGRNPVNSVGWQTAEFATMVETIPSCKTPILSRFGPWSRNRQIPLSLPVSFCSNTAAVARHGNKVNRSVLRMSSRQ
jgi:hypothetical protein